ncbi:MAG TPA: polysaccharide lyase family 7 protein [Pseudonocardia sp.]|nr:polysaccharide lyase family 7 protein [Pseudonocardia sp.]
MVVPALLVKAVVLGAVALPAVLVGPTATGSVPGPVRVASTQPAADDSDNSDDSDSDNSDNSDKKCDGPAKVLDLANWKVTLPIAKSGNAKSPEEVTQPDLATFETSPWFETSSDCGGVVFRAPVNGVTTSGSRNPRSELREMTDDGTTNASWSSTAGTHTMVVNEAFTHLPDVKPELVGAQIHDADDDITVFRLEGTNLYVTKGNDPHYKLVTSDYALGTRFEAKYVVTGGKIEAYYNGALQTTISEWFRGAYFKAGAYTQANCTDSKPCSKSNYGETTVYSVVVSHQVTQWQLIRDWIMYAVPYALGVLVVAALGFLLWRRQRARRTV